MAEPVQEHEPKFNDIELIVGSIVLGIVDLIGIALIFIGLDDFFLMDLIVDPFLLWYYNHKGLLGTRMFTKAIWGQIIAELVPWLGDLPFYTIGFWVIFWIDRHPKIEALTEEAGMAIAAAEGAGAAGAAEGAAGAEAAAAGAEGAAAAGEAGVASAEGAAAGAEGAAAAGEAAEAAEGAEAAAGEGAEGAEGEKKG